jgi:hypothetical protein
MSVTGGGRHTARLKNLRTRARARLGAVVYEGADMIRVEARRLITTGSVSGKGHVASRPGEPPNRDTGHLDTNIEAAKTGDLSAETRSSARYAKIEFGLGRVAARPYMGPAARKMKPKIIEKARQHVKVMVQGS